LSWGSSLSLPPAVVRGGNGRSDPAVLHREDIAAGRRMAGSSVGVGGGVVPEGDPGLPTARTAAGEGEKGLADEINPSGKRLVRHGSHLLSGRIKYLNPIY